MSRRPSSATDGLRRVGGGQAVNGSKMLKEIRKQPEVLERVLDEGWGEVTVLYAIPPQMLAHNLSRLKRLDPDAPRGLSKVTETW
jgi:glucosamine 6-phosphate synthetase-like amidotransferase/phosphosugar isomerase protein